MYHQTNLDCKSFSIRMIVALTLNIAKLYFWMILWLMMRDHHTQFDQSEILSRQIFTEVQTLTVTLTLNIANQPFHKTLQLMNMHYQTKLVTLNNQQFWTYNRNSHIWLYEPKFNYYELDIGDRNPFFTYDALAYNDVSPYWVWLQMV